MTELRESLVRCFAAVFPALPAEEIPRASVETVEEWDSLAAVTLLTVLEEEFDVEIDELDLPGLRSFDAVHRHLQAQLS